ncbi:PilN domain-containing protein [Rhodoferax sp.]|uniref:PilN domain-containing protein n=1 Tax=Rhodoferax sp. TaxID=50421 RepID=UPI0027555F4A|nr:PilN domain-containing protein [Rhodoferax sp.]
MPQQINLCTPILLTQRRYFSALTIVQALAVFVLVGGALCGYWVWSLGVASEGLRKVLAANAVELASLRAAIKEGRAASGPAEQALNQALQAQRTEMQRRSAMLEALQRGLVKPGWGHAARLRLLAQTIPASVWITHMKADDSQLEISGFTLEPAALNDWTTRLAASPTLQEQRLATIKVESANATRVGALASPATVSLWSFSLVSALRQSEPGQTGSKP